MNTIPAAPERPAEQAGATDVAGLYGRYSAPWPLTPPSTWSRPRG